MLVLLLSGGVCLFVGVVVGGLAGWRAGAIAGFEDAKDFFGDAE